MNVIFDFMGVIADADYIKLLTEMPLSNKFGALRIVAGMKKHPEIKLALNHYQRGLLDRNELHDVIAQFYPKSAHVVHDLLDRFHSYITVNKNVIALAQKLKQNGIRTFLISNTIPETAQVMKQYNLESAFEGIILSHELGLKKPSVEIFKYAIERYGIDPNETIFIDDTKKNLLATKTLGITPIQCKNTKETCNLINQIFSEILAPKKQDEPERKIMN